VNLGPRKKKSEEGRILSEAIFQQLLKDLFEGDSDFVSQLLLLTHQEARVNASKSFAPETRSAAPMKAQFMGLNLFVMRGFDGRWKTWILNSLDEPLFIGSTPADASERDAKAFVWRMACERKAFGAAVEPEWEDPSGPADVPGHSQGGSSLPAWRPQRPL
jgi:hypothetical protein